MIHINISDTTSPALNLYHGFSMHYRYITLIKLIKTVINLHLNVITKRKQTNKHPIQLSIIKHLRSFLMEVNARKKKNIEQF